MSFPSRTCAIRGPEALPLRYRSVVVFGMISWTSRVFTPTIEEYIFTVSVTALGIKAQATMVQGLAPVIQGLAPLAIGFRPSGGPRQRQRHNRTPFRGLCLSPGGAAANSQGCQTLDRGCQPLERDRQPQERAASPKTGPRAQRMVYTGHPLSCSDTLEREVTTCSCDAWPCCPSSSWLP